MMRGYVTPASSIDSDDKTGKIIGAVVIAVAIGAAGAYGYTTGIFNSQPVTANSVQAAPSNPAPAVVSAPAPTPAPVAQTTVTPPPAAVSPQDSAPVRNDTVAPRAPVHTVRSIHARGPATKLVAPAQPVLTQQAAPDQGAPAPAPSDTQTPMQAAPQITPDTPATATPSVPATDQPVPATPAPATTDDQTPH